MRPKLYVHRLRLSTRNSVETNGPYVSMMDVALIRWPSDQALHVEMAHINHPRLLLVDPRADPPTSRTSSRIGFGCPSPPQTGTPGSRSSRSGPHRRCLSSVATGPPFSRGERTAIRESGLSRANVDRRVRGGGESRGNGRLGVARQGRNGRQPASHGGATETCSRATRPGDPRCPLPRISLTTSDRQPHRR
jgi:hypothetical protein